jgi:hypothetical protein
MYATNFGCVFAFGSKPKLTPDFYKGLIFMKDRDILLTGNKWTLAVNIALDDYLNLIRGMRFILVQIQRNIGKYQSPDRRTLDIQWGRDRAIAEDYGLTRSGLRKRFEVIVGRSAT